VWGVVAVDGALGIWPFVAAVLVVTAAGAGWYLLYLHLTAKKVESTARQLRAQTAAKCQETVTKLTAAGRLDEAAQLGMACAAAGQAADAPPAGTLDRIADGLFKIGAGLAGAGLGIGALLGLALLFRSSRKSGGKSSSAGKRLRWHRPVSFHRPVSYE
jgi:hypothetical protein